MGFHLVVPRSNGAAGPGRCCSSRCSWGVVLGRATRAFARSTRAGSRPSSPTISTPFSARVSQPYLVGRRTRGDRDGRSRELGGGTRPCLLAGYTRVVSRIIVREINPRSSAQALRDIQNLEPEREAGSSPRRIRRKIPCLTPLSFVLHRPKSMFSTVTFHTVRGHTGDLSTGLSTRSGAEGGGQCCNGPSATTEQKPERLSEPCKHESRPTTQHLGRHTWVSTNLTHKTLPARCTPRSCG
jgi:hypothetical protein